MKLLWAFSFLLLSVELINASTLIGVPSLAKVMENDCSDPEVWSIRVEPELGSNLLGQPYVQGQHEVAGCGANDTYTNNNTNLEYQFVLNTTALQCGMTAEGDDKFSVILVFPKRDDGVETVDDHLLEAGCKVPGPQYHYNETVDRINPRYTNFNPNVSDDVGVTAPTITVNLLRGSTALSAGDTAILGEMLTIKVTVDDGAVNIYTKVKVEKLWATYVNDHKMPNPLNLVRNGCAIESTIMENFTIQGTSEEIAADFRVFRFSNQQNVYLWLDVISCPSNDEDDTCALCGGSSKRRKREAILIPLPSSGTLGPVSGLTKFRLVVLNPAVGDGSHGGKIEFKPDTKPVPPEPEEVSTDVCLTVTQTAVVSFMGFVIIAITLIVAIVLFVKLRAVHRRHASTVAYLNESTASTQGLCKSAHC